MLQELQPLLQLPGGHRIFPPNVLDVKGRAASIPSASIAALSKAFCTLARWNKEQFHSATAGRNLNACLPLRINYLEKWLEVLRAILFIITSFCSVSPRFQLLFYLFCRLNFVCIYFWNFATIVLVTESILFNNIKCLRPENKAFWNRGDYLSTRCIAMHIHIQGLSCPVKHLIMLINALVPLNTCVWSEVGLCLLFSYTIIDFLKRFHALYVIFLSTFLFS